MKFFRKYHKWAGLVLAFFMVMFAVSGIILNHRKTFSGIDISRGLLPRSYHYNNWNNASIKGTIKLTADSVLLYGGAGIWLTDSLQSKFYNFTNGIKTGADNRATARIVKTSNGNVYAATTFDLYKLTCHTWENITDLTGINERISDMEAHDDTLVVLTRSHIYHSTAPYTKFTKTELQQPEGYKAQTSVFRVLWLLHSGKLFGTGGKFFVDFLGIILIIVSVTGVIYFFCPTLIKRKRKKGHPAKSTYKTLTTSIKWHNKLGVLFFIFFVLIVLTGMFLRPPLMITIIKSKINNPPYTVLSDTNPWNDKLRTIRYDDAYQQWLIYTSSGFYTLEHLRDIPRALTATPPVSVMGVTVLEKVPQGWLVGSFSGLFYWNRTQNYTINYYTKQPVPPTRQGRPVSLNPISGYSRDLKGETVFEYNKGAVDSMANIKPTPMPMELGKGRISLWNTSLEVHTGRMYSYLFGLSGDLYPFLMGLVTLILLISGYSVYRKKYRKSIKKIKNRI